MSGSAGTTFVADVRPLSARKTVGRPAYLPPAGARLGVRPVHGGGASSPAAELVTDAHGRTASLDLDPGVYEVVETEAPAGYAPAGPWRVDLTAGDAVLEASNTALWGAARIAKVDAASQRPVAGARLALAYDADRDGSFETALTPLLSAGQPETRQLPPGDYELRETAAPPGYRLSQRPVRFSVAPGRLTPVEVANSPLPPSPAKRPVGPVGPTPDRTSAERGPPRGPLPSTENELLGLAAAGWALVMSGAVLTAGARPSTRRARRRAELLRPRAGRPLPR